MGKKIVLGKRPESFKHTVTFPMLEGGEGMIECSYRYRTRPEFGALIDATFGEADATDDGKFSLEKFQKQTCEASGKYLMAILTGWNLDVELTEDACVQLVAEVPAAAVAIMNDYRLAITEGRLGN